MRPVTASAATARRTTFAGNVGLPLGQTGFANLSLEYGNAEPTNRAIQRNDAANLRAAGNTNVRDPAQVWGAPLIEDDLKIFGNYGYLFDNGLQWYAHNNYASKTVTGGFYFRNPNTRGAVFSGDGGDTLLVGDVLAATGRGSANCPTVAIVNNAPDPVAFGQVTENPNCFTFHQPFLGATGGSREGSRRSSAPTCTTCRWSPVSAASRAAGSPGTRA